MYRVSRQIDFCYGHRLLHYEGKCRYLHGHNGRAIITIEAPQLDARGMVRDFGDIKRLVSSWIDEHLDHRMILHRDDPAVAVLRQLGEPMYLIDANPTAETIARLIHEFTVERGFPVREVRLWETPKCCATYIVEGLRAGEERIQVLDIKALPTTAEVTAEVVRAKNCLDRCPAKRPET